MPRTKGAQFLTSESVLCAEISWSSRASSSCSEHSLQVTLTNVHAEALQPNHAGHDDFYCPHHRKGSCKHAATTSRLFRVPFKIPRLRAHLPLSLLPTLCLSHLCFPQIVQAMRQVLWAAVIPRSTLEAQSTAKNLP